MTLLPGTEHLLPKFLKNLPETPEPAQWVCDICGVVEPKALTWHGATRYSRQKCACQKAEEERRRCEEQHQAVMSHRARRTYNWLGERWSDLDLLQKTFSNFDASRQPEAYKAAQMFAAYPSGTLVLHGTFGTGKTHLLAAICHATLYEVPYPTYSLFTTSPNLFAVIQARIQAKEDYSHLLSSAIQTPLLIIDDIDKAKWSEFREEIYFEIVDKRVKAGRPIAISTNKLSRLDEYVGGAVCSRFKTGQIAVEMIGRDFREEL